MQNKTKKKKKSFHVSVPWYQAQFWRLERCKLSGARTTLHKCFVRRGNALIIPWCVANAAAHSHVWLAHSKKTLESQPELMCTNHLQSFSQNVCGRIETSWTSSWKRLERRDCVKLWVNTANTDQFCRYLNTVSSVYGSHNCSIYTKC